MKSYIAVAIVVFAFCYHANGLTEVQQLEKEYLGYQQQLQHWQSEYNRRVNELTRAITIYNNSVRTKQSQSQINRNEAATKTAQFRCDHAQKQIDSTKNSMQAISQQLNDARKREYAQKKAEQQRQWDEEQARKKREREQAQKNQDRGYQLAADLTRTVENMRARNLFDKPRGVTIAAKISTAGRWDVEIRTPGLAYHKILSGAGTVIWNTTTERTCLTGRHRGNKVQIWVKDLTGNGRVPAAAGSVQILKSGLW